jgi:hypothetical protein
MYSAVEVTFWKTLQGRGRYFRKIVGKLFHITHKFVVPGSEFKNSNEAAHKRSLGAYKL